MKLKPGHSALRTVCERAEETDDGAMRFVASTDSVDRYDSRVMQYWRLDDFMRNPVFLWGHDSRSKPVGRVESFDVEGSRSIASVQFAPTDEGEELRNLYAQGFLNAVSVGFRAGSVTYIEDDDIVELGSAEHPNELFELSGVTLPGNAEALAEGRSKGLTDNIDRQLRALFEPIVGRTLEGQDLDLLRAGALPAQLDVLRSIHDRLDRFEAMAPKGGQYSNLLESSGFKSRVMEQDGNPSLPDDLAPQKKKLDESGEPVIILINDDEQE